MEKRWDGWRKKSALFLSEASISEGQLPKLAVLPAEESYSEPHFLFFAMRKWLHHFQPKKKDSPEEQPVLIRSTEKTSHHDAHKRPFILNRPLSSHLNSHFLSTTPRPRGWKEKPPSTCVALSRHEGALPDQAEVALSHLPRCRHLLWMQQLCRPIRKSGTKEFCPLKISTKTRRSSQDRSKVTTEEQDVA